MDIKKLRHVFIFLIVQVLLGIYNAIYANGFVANFYLWKDVFIELGTVLINFVISSVLIVFVIDKYFLVRKNMRLRIIGMVFSFSVVSCYLNAVSIVNFGYIYMEMNYPGTIADAFLRYLSFYVFYGSLFSLIWVTVNINELKKKNSESILDN